MALVAELRQPSLKRGECRPESGARLVGGYLLGARFDDGDLRIDQVADSSVIADFAQAPGDLPQHPRTLAHRRQPLFQREAVERLGGRLLGRLDRAAHGGERVVQIVSRGGCSGGGFRGLLLVRRSFPKRLS